MSKLQATHGQLQRKQVLPVSIRKSNREWGLAASSQVASFSLDVDQAAEQDLWRATLQTPRLSIVILLEDQRALIAAADLLQSAAGSGQQSKLGTWNHHPVSLIRDDEFLDRAFLLIGRPNTTPLRFTLQGADLDAIRKLLADVAGQL